jgi:hypothetical protein
MNSESATIGQEQAKKPYEAPQLIEHGTVEEITGFFDEVQHSGATFK